MSDTKARYNIWQAQPGRDNVAQPVYANNPDTTLYLQVGQSHERKARELLQRALDRGEIGPGVYAVVVYTELRSMVFTYAVAEETKLVIL